ncbi:GNAT family N-acetyltransferase [uncultured Friedmanniella sp.]|uniref:GNAT family N-acetyltransferase n=1 Tax=uncultured Friedmanniella sp. TaxID=335381 RepID=UPI0035CB85BD
MVSPTALRRQLTDQSRAVRTAFGVFDGAVCLGTAVLERDTEQNTHLGEVDVNVVPEQRRLGLGSRLLTAALEQADAAGLTTLTGEVNAADPTSPGLGFAAAQGFGTVHTELRLVLDLPVHDDRLDKLSRSTRAAEHGYRVTSWCGPTPKEHLETLAALRTGMNADVPAGELDADPEVVTAASLAARDERLAARGYLSVVGLATAPDGRAAGYSQVLVHGDDPTNAVQDDTYVLAAHRGRRIGTLLKATVLAVLQHRAPQVRHLHTWTDELNSPMQVINAAFGFRPVEVMHQVQRGGRG